MRSITLALVLGLMTVSAFAAPPAVSTPVKVGHWGSSGFPGSMTVEAERAVITLGCSRIAIDHRVEVNAKGDFTVSAMRHSGSFGPRMSVGEPVTVKGHLKGDELSIEIIDQGGDRPPTKVTLKFNLVKPLPVCA